MSIWTRFSKNVSSKNWDHLRFLQLMTLALLLNLLMVIALMLVFTQNNTFSEEYGANSLRDILSGTISGLIVGITLQFFILLRPYIQKNWDLHEVVPYSLFFSAFLGALIILGFTFTEKFSQLREIGISIGFFLGTLLTTIAYVGEVKKEHPQDEVLIEE